MIAIAVFTIQVVWHGHTHNDGQQQKSWSSQDLSKPARQLLQVDKIGAFRTVEDRKWSL